MEKNDFQSAFTRAEARHGTAWPLMALKAQTIAIYLELRELDQKAARHRRHSMSTSEQGADQGGSFWVLGH